MFCVPDDPERMVTQVTALCLNGDVRGPASRLGSPAGEPDQPHPHRDGKKPDQPQPVGPEGVERLERGFEPAGREREQKALEHGDEAEPEEPVTQQARRGPPPARARRRPAASPRASAGS